LNEHSNFNKSVTKEQKSVKSSLENIDKEFRTTNIKMEGYRDDSAEGLDRMKEDFRERLADIDKYYSDALERMTTDLEGVRYMAKN
jgi:uncharacterized membrane-anchored protein YhcB (DUF1043 family)